MRRPVVGLVTMLALVPRLWLAVPEAQGRIFAFRETISGDDLVPGLGSVGGVAIAPDGRHLYTTTVREGFPAIDRPVIDGFIRGPTGALGFFLFHVEDPKYGPLCGIGPIVVSPDGANVYTSAACDGSVRVLGRDPATGVLTALPSPRHVDGRQDGLAESLSIPIALSPDGTSLYAAGGDQVIGTYRRDPANGSLTFQDALALPGGGLRTVGTMAVSPDARSLYVTATDQSSDDDALLVFARDPDTGALTLLETQQDGANGFASLTDFFSVAVSPDGRHVYAGAVQDEPVLVAFARDAGSGKLTVVQAQVLQDPLIRARSLVVSPDGEFVYAAGESRLAVLHRDPDTGRLAFVEAYDDDRDGFDGLASIGYYSAPGIAVSPDGVDLYVAGSGDSAVAHLRKICGDGRIDPDEGCDDGNNADGDGCSALCVPEACWTCLGEPSTCVARDGGPCDDGDACTANGTCHAGRCEPGTPVNEGGACEMGNPCVTGAACRSGHCLPGAAVECGPCGTCDPRYGCVGVVWSHCFSSPEVGASGLLDVTLAPDGEKTLAWRWRPTRGADRGVGHLGFPQVLTDYTFCVLDHSEVGFAARRRRRVVLALSIPPGGRCGRKQCWQGRRGGYLYSDPSGSAGGVNRLLITPGKTMSPAIAIAAHGPRLDVGPLPIQGEATAQLRNRDGACWDASYSGFVKIDDTRRFKGRAGRQPEDYDEGH